MKAALKEFTGSRVRGKRYGSSGPVQEMDLFCTFVLEDGKERSCRVRLKHTAGLGDTDRVIELGPVTGLPAGAEYDQGAFTKEARRYYLEQLLKRSS